MTKLVVITGIGYGKTVFDKKILTAILRDHNNNVIKSGTYRSIEEEIEREKYMVCNWDEVSNVLFLLNAKPL